MIRSKRYAKLIADEKANAEKKGFLNGGGGVPKKRGAPTVAASPNAKKTKPTKMTQDIGDEVDAGGHDNKNFKKEEDGAAE
jgi:hypothetical protein